MPSYARAKALFEAIIPPNWHNWIIYGNSLVFRNMGRTPNVGPRIHNIKLYEALHFVNISYFTRTPVFRLIYQNILSYVKPLDKTPNFERFPQTIQSL